MANDPTEFGEIVDNPTKVKEQTILQNKIAAFLAVLIPALVAAGVKIPNVPNEVIIYVSGVIAAAWILFNNHRAIITSRKLGSKPK